MAFIDLNKWQICCLGNKPKPKSNLFKVSYLIQDRYGSVTFDFSPKLWEECDVQNADEVELHIKNSASKVYGMIMNYDYRQKIKKVAEEMQDYLNTLVDEGKIKMANSNQNWKLVGYREPRLGEHFIQENDYNNRPYILANGEFSVLQNHNPSFISTRMIVEPIINEPVVFYYAQSKTNNLISGKYYKNLFDLINILKSTTLKPEDVLIYRIMEDGRTEKVAKSTYLVETIVQNWKV